MLTLCYEHHCEIHGKSYRDRIHHRELTRKGMQKAREMGVKFGNPNLADVNRTRVRKAHKYAWEHKDLLLSLKDSGMSLMQMCDILMNKNIKTRSGFRNWNPTQVRRMLKRIENEPQTGNNHFRGEGSLGTVLATGGGAVHWQLRRKDGHNGVEKI